MNQILKRKRESSMAGAAGEERGPDVDMAALRDALEGPELQAGSFAPPGHPDRAPSPAPPTHDPNGPILRILRVCDEAAATIVAQAKQVVGQADEYLAQAEIFAKDVKSIGEQHARRLEEFGHRIKDALGSLKEQQKLLTQVDDAAGRMRGPEER